MLLNREQREQLKQVGSFSTIGLELGLSVALGYIGGLASALGLPRAHEASTGSSAAHSG